jgi:PAS domain S-box-containing protein
MLKMPSRGTLPNWWGYPIAVVLVGLATWLKYLAQPSIIPADVPILYLLAIVPTAIYFGLGPSILVCILSLLAFNYFFISPLNQFIGLDRIQNAPILLIFIAVGLLFSSLASNLRSKNEQAVKEIATRKQSEAELAKHRDQLEELVKQRTSDLEKANASLEQEIIECKQLEEAMANSELRYRRLFETAQDAILILNGDNGQIIDANPFIKDLLGYSLEELKGKNLWEIGEFRDTLASKLSNQQLHDTGYVRYEHLPLVTKDGRSIAVEVVANAYKVDHVKVIQCNIRDIADRKKAEQMKDEFIGMVSHELKTPLTVIIGALSVAQSDGLSREEALELTRDAASSAGDLAIMVENLLELSRYQSDRFALNAQPVDIGLVVRDIISRHYSESAIHRLSMDIPTSLPTVTSDPVRIDLIIHNLVDNAIKYSPEGGDVKVFVHFENNHIIVGVSDQGIGISTEDQSRIFQRFERIDAYKTHSIAGVGLGLRVCRILAEVLGGRIWVESSTGKGSTFYFSLPFAPVSHLSDVG